ncbi:methionyl-tRNA formyltransferase [Ruicaihuangia caeni]|uniref:Methionyl-tRNA formyltransferase n=1 Tax=Ruicaihuangia caeni TaxID=3042517 RepID=A0AAW6T7K0_9MICO|nr:methionyl-tRNA formyltransferase [Klugiella sp. YN-L-19]MDI2098080.1 methionyl-tRNA formyltransferase [Klugiella sp. YN-L-19]
MRIVFAGSPAVAVPSLDAISASPHTVQSVITRHDSPLGRKRVITPTPVGARADELGIPTLKANRLDDEAGERIAALRPDLGVIVAYGALVREPLLSVPRLGWINLHFSLLPRWRGAAPVQHAIMAGDDITGACVFQLVEELDAGDVYGHLTEPIGSADTAGELLERLSHSGARLLAEVVDAIARGEARALPQQGDVTLAPKPTERHARIDWQLDARSIHNRVRGVTPEPGAFTEVDGARLKVLRAALHVADDRMPDLAPGALRLHDGALLAGTGTTPIELLEVQPAGRKPMRAADWWRGHRPEQAQ